MQCYKSFTALEKSVALKDIKLQLLTNIIEFLKNNNICSLKIISNFD